MNLKITLKHKINSNETFTPITNDISSFFSSFLLFYFFQKTSPFLVSPPSLTAFTRQSNPDSTNTQLLCLFKVFIFTLRPEIRDEPQQAINNNKAWNTQKKQKVAQSALNEPEIINAASEFNSEFQHIFSVTKNKRWSIIIIESWVFAFKYLK